MVNVQNTDRDQEIEGADDQDLLTPSFRAPAVHAPPSGASCRTQGPVEET